MAQWYAVVQGQQYGPVPEQEMRDWIAVGRVKPTDNVWSDGLPNWVPAAQAFPSVMATIPPALPSAGLFPALPPRPQPRPNQTPTSLMSEGWHGLSGRWGLPIGFCVLVGLVRMGIQMVPYLGPLAGLLTAGALQLGSIVFFLTLCRGGTAELGMMFAGFKMFGKALGASLLVALLVMLWTLLLIVPGIIKGLAYSQTLYLLADNPDMGITEAIDRSQTIMMGKKMDLFVLGLLFIPIIILGILTLFIGFLWIAPFMAATYARFYDSLDQPPQPTVAATY